MNLVMKQNTVCFLLTYLLCCLLTLNGIIGINLPSQLDNPRSRSTKPSVTTINPSVVTLASNENTKEGAVTYRYASTLTGATCILLSTDGVVEINYKLHDLEEQTDSFLPEKVLVDGNCKQEDIANMRIQWNGYSLLLVFAKTPGGELWYIDNIELTVSPDLPQLQGLQTHGKAIKLYHKKMLIPTPIGRSYSCKELTVDLEPEKNGHAPKGLKGSLLLRLLQVQPFMYKNENFEPAIECKGQKNFRDETTPIAVGSTLAVAVLLTIGGYAAFRYFRVKNVQYNTME